MDDKYVIFIIFNLRSLKKFKIKILGNNIFERGLQLKLSKLCIVREGGYTLSYNKHGKISRKTSRERVFKL